MMNEIRIDRRIKLMLLGWLKNGAVNPDELRTLNDLCKGAKELSMDEARAFLRELEETY